MVFQILQQGPGIAVAFILALVIAITVHEFAHALAGFLQGDMTAKSEGRLTLNPLAHLDPMGSIMLLLAGFGWGKPTPYNPYNLRYPKWGPALVALAGPAANFLLVVVFLVALKFAYPGLGPENLLTVFMELLVFINLMLMVFNLLPLPPLDGSQVLFTFLPPRFNDFKARLIRNGPMILLAFIIIDNFLPVSIFGSIYTFFLRLVSFFV